MENLTAPLHPKSTVNTVNTNELTACLSCGSNECILQNKINYFTSTAEGFTSSAVSSQLNVIFILKHLLQVPTTSLQTYLVKLGNPTNWQISLCEQCNQLVNQAKDLHFQILAISTKLKKIQKEIVDKAKNLQANNQYLCLADNPSSVLNNNPVYQETWQFVKNHNYDDYFRSDPILEGNQLIKKFLDGDAASLSTKVKNELDLHSVEEPFNDNLNDHHDDQDNWTPSPEATKATRSPRKRKIRPRTPASNPGQDKRRGKRRPLKIKIVDKKEREHKSDKDKAKDKPFGCDKCKFRTGSVPALFRHLEESHPEHKEVRCPFEENCEVTLKSVMQWRSHQASHLRTVTTCHLCGVRISSGSLAYHLARKHGGEEGGGGGGQLFRCTVMWCDGKYLSEKALEGHINKMHGGGEGDDGGEKGYGVKVRERYFCSFCGKGFFQRRYMLRHELLHRNKETKPFICEICGKRFATEAYVRDHKRYKHFGTMNKKTKKTKRKSKRVKDEDATYI